MERKRKEEREIMGEKERERKREGIFREMWGDIEGGNERRGEEEEEQKREEKKMESKGNEDREDSGRD